MKVSLRLFHIRMARVYRLRGTQEKPETEQHNCETDDRK